MPINPRFLELLAAMTARAQPLMHKMADTQTFGAVYVDASVFCEDDGALGVRLVFFPHPLTATQDEMMTRFLALDAQPCPKERINK